MPRHCELCGKTLRRFRDDPDWETRRFHKGCMKYVDFDRLTTELERERRRREDLEFIFQSEGFAQLDLSMPRASGQMDNSN